MSAALPARASNKKMARHVCNRFIVEAEPNQEVMPIKLPPLLSLKNVSICYNDGGFFYFPPPLMIGEMIIIDPAFVPWLNPVASHSCTFGSLFSLNSDFVECHYINI